METPSTQGGRGTGCCVVLMMKSAARSKRRLAEHIGAQRATQAAQRLARLRLRGPRQLGPVPSASRRRQPTSAIDAPPADAVVVQRGGNLGERINHVNDELIRLGFERQLYIGIDCPSLDVAYLERAAAALGDHETVLGPAADGGVVLMGVRGRWPPLAELPWSTTALFESLRAACVAAGSSAATLPRLKDVDTLGDLRRATHRASRRCAAGAPCARALAHGANGSRPMIALRAAVVALLLAAIVAVAVGWPLGSWITGAAAWAERHREAAGALFVAVYVLAAVLVVPGSILTLAAGYLFGLPLGVALTSAGSVLGAAAAFVVGRFVARDWVARRVATWPRFGALDAAMHHDGFAIVLLARLSPLIPYNLLNYGLSITAARFRDYLLATWIGMLPAIVLYVYTGSLAKSLTTLTSAAARRTGRRTRCSRSVSRRRPRSRC